MALAGALRLSLACLVLCTAAPKPTCDPGACAPCPERDVEGPTAAGSCCPPCPPPCACPPYLESDCEMQGFASGHVPVGRSFYVDFARKLCTCQPGGDIACAPLCPRLPPACQAVGSPVADGCPRCVCYDEEEMAVPAGTVTTRGAQICTCPPPGGPAAVQRWPEPGVNLSSRPAEDRETSRAAEGFLHRGASSLKRVKCFRLS